ncbi:carbohydrate esterase family 1 protein [Astrocystis sublimbata]|nr:carbohydrate esterase family 1 protein [Astrocystis sublimbata]
MLKMAFELKSRIATFGGELLKLSHASTSTSTPMAVSIYLPPASSSSSPAPVLLYLSGLTCTPDNCSEKGFLHATASKKGMAIVYPDTSPRGAGIAGEDEAYDFGSGAGFYIDATTEAWKGHYNMERYITTELLSSLFDAKKSPADLGFNLAEKLDKSRVSITGHSMGGHGALTLYMKNPGLFKSVSAFAPICNPTKCPWGEKAFKGYLGEDKEGWKKHDATELVKGGEWKGKDLKALIDVGTGDNFYKQGQLLPENFEAAVKEAGVSGVTVRYQEKYDHSYFFISSFAEDHVEHAAKYLL